MLLGFLIKDAEDWKRWRTMNKDIMGKPVVHVADNEPVPLDNDFDQRTTVDAVEAFDNENESDSELLRL